LEIQDYIIKNQNKMQDPKFAEPKD